MFEVLHKVSPERGVKDWAELQRMMEPLAKAASALPPTAIRLDPGVAVTALGRYLPHLLSSGADASKLVGPFSKVRCASQRDAGVCPARAHPQCISTNQRSAAPCALEWHNQSAWLMLSLSASQCISVVQLPVPWSGTTNLPGSCSVSVHLSQPA